MQSLEEVRAHLLASEASKEPLELVLPAGAHYRLGGTQLEVDGFNLTLRGSRSGATLDAEEMSRLLFVTNGAHVELYNLQLINGRPPLDANGRPVPDAFMSWFNFPDTGFARARPPPAIRRPLSAALPTTAAPSLLLDAGVGHGGAMAVSNDSHVVLNRVSIAHCFARYAGAIDLDMASALIVDSDFWNCSAKFGGVMDGLVFNASLLRCVVRYCRADGSQSSGDLQTLGGVFNVQERYESILLVERATLIGGHRPILPGLGLLLLTLERSLSSLEACRDLRSSPQAAPEQDFPHSTFRPVVLMVPNGATGRQLLVSPRQPVDCGGLTHHELHS